MVRRVCRRISFGFKKMGAFNNSNSFLDSGKNFPNISEFKKTITSSLDRR